MPFSRLVSAPAGEHYQALQMINAERAAQDAVLEEMSKVLDDLKDVAETIGDVRCGRPCVYPAGLLPAHFIIAATPPTAAAERGAALIGSRWLRQLSTTPFSFNPRLPF